MPLLEPEELAEIRAAGELGMIDPFTVRRAELIVMNPDAPGYDAGLVPDYDYGDDALTTADPIYSYSDDSTIVYGWLVEKKLAADSSIGEGQLATVDVHTLRLPWGTDVRPSDLVVSQTDEEFTVVDTNGDNTWAEWLQATLRRRE